MKQLSGLDASFLYMETPEMPMHVGALHLFEMPAAYKGSFIADLRRHIASRLPIAAALRQKLAWMPFNLANPVWIDAVPDLDELIVPVKLQGQRHGRAAREDRRAASEAARPRSA